MTRTCPKCDTKKRICPRCFEEITELKMYVPAEMVYHIRIDGNGNTDVEGTETIDIVDCHHEIDIECPECSEVLFHDQEKAEDWLSGDDSVQPIPYTQRYFPVIRMCYEDVEQCFITADQPKLAEAVQYLPNHEMIRILEKVQNSIFEGGGVWEAMETYFEEELTAIAHRRKDTCAECGRPVHQSSGNWANRIPILDSFEVRQENGHRHPLGEYICAECDAKRALCNCGREPGFHIPHGNCVNYKGENKLDRIG